MKPHKLLIRGAMLDGVVSDVHIAGDRIVRIEPAQENIEPASDLEVIDGHGYALIPGFTNAHTHAAMTLMRGIGDDMRLRPWLEEKIWPNEALLTAEDVYWGTKLACLEMIKSGTTCFYDMYRDAIEASAAAVDEMGIRAVLSETCFDHFSSSQRELCKLRVTSHFANVDGQSVISPAPSRIRYALGPHAIYTVSGELLRWLSEFSQEHDLPMHLHLAETLEELSECRNRFGTTPVRYLSDLGILSNNLTLAHVIYVDDEEIAILGAAGVKVAHNPASNMKIASGNCFRYAELCKAGALVGLGTDGCASSNNLDMIEAMKLASFLGKSWRGDPEAMPCAEVFRMATESGALIAGFGDGRLSVGSLADMSLVDLSLPVFTPNHNFLSNLVFASNGSCIDTVICGGRVLMRHREIAGEFEILEEVRRIACKLKP